MRVHTTSAGLDPHSLTPGEDLVLNLDEAHGTDLAEGVLAHDLLGIETRREVDRVSLDALARWRTHYDRPLTVDGVCLPWIWEADALEIVVPIVCKAAGLRSALMTHLPRCVTLSDTDVHTERLVTATASACGVSVRRADDARPVYVSAPAAGRRPLLLRMRRHIRRWTDLSGAPSMLRSNAILLDCYWPLMPLLDRMVAEKGWRPAVWLQQPPTGPMRSLRAARRGGWIGLPGPLDRRRARRLASEALAAASRPPELNVLGIPLGECIHEAVMELAWSRAAVDLSDAALLRRVFARGSLRKVVGTADARRPSRVMLSVAEEARIPRLLVTHGAYLIPQTLGDMEAADEVAIWSETVGCPPPRLLNRRRPVHVVGYPIPHTRPTARTVRGLGETPRVLVLAATWAPSTAMLDARSIMRHYVTACSATTSRFPRARVVLRPHPADDRGAPTAVVERFRRFDLEIDTTTDIMGLLAESELCIGSTSTATLQAALVATPVVVLNLSRFEWPWPLGGQTAVPIARSEPELAWWLDRWAEDGALPGQTDLLDGLGADGGDTTERLLRLLRPGARIAAPSPRSPLDAAQRESATK